MVARVRSAQVRLLPHGPVDVIRQVLLFAGAYYAYELVRGSVNGQVAPAFQHARQLISVERTLHVFVEPSIQAWASGSHWLIGASTWIYINAQTSITLASLVFLYLFRNRSFYFVRNMFLVSMGIALVVYTFFPTAPPRLLPEWGFFDSISDATGVHATNGSVNAFFNQYAAVPSMHVGFAVMLGVTFARLSRRRIVQVGGLVYPLLVTFVTVVTANHFLADAFLGALTAAAAAYAASWLGRTRPHVWGFGGAAPEGAPLSPAPAEAGAPA